MKTFTKRKRNGPTARYAPRPAKPENAEVSAKGKVLYFAGCMSHLTPKIIKSVESLMKASGTEWEFLDKDKGICCGRPLMLAGKTQAARKAIQANKALIEASGCKTLLLSCPICLKVFKEEYGLKGIEILHYTQFIDRLAKEGKITLEKGTEAIVYHDPCELGRGCGIYNEPRNVLSAVGDLKKAPKERDESVCCGYSLGSMTLDEKDRAKIAEHSVDPMCYRAIRSKSPVPVKDFAEAVVENIKPSKTKK